MITAHMVCARCSSFPKPPQVDMGVSNNRDTRDTPKWMVKTMENPIKMDDLGVPLFSETSMYTIVDPYWSVQCFW